MASQISHFSMRTLLHDNQLGQDGNRLQQNRKCPHQFHYVEIVNASSNHMNH
jgi:hypothetical protein